MSRARLEAACGLPVTLVRCGASQWRAGEWAVYAVPTNPDGLPSSAGWAFSVATDDWSISGWQVGADLGTAWARFAAWVCDESGSRLDASISLGGLDE